MSTIPLETTLARGTGQGVGARAVRHSREALQHVVAVLREWRRRSRDRAALAGFDDRMLRDIGVTRADVLVEINKPFWRK
jgi:uncharacterized protein YjiS (DUF1127 family)